MAMIDIEYRHSSEPVDGGEIRRTSVDEMSDYLKKLVYEMQMADISSKFVSKEQDGPNALYINGKKIQDILNGLDIKPLEVEDSCDHGKPNMVTFNRPVLDWKHNVIEDIPDVLVKNAISKVYSDIINNKVL
ncbi:MAG: hypothetical protein LBV63_04675 [Candidatus Methanoplasma sp.]|jgi:hypothetical protein|nr:hypothetical protein [Candidatus Methanoplasma sp.]